jgi:hypothetical protein
METKWSYLKTVWHPAKCGFGFAKILKFTRPLETGSDFFLHPALEV